MNKVEVIKHLKSILSAEQIVVTGSTALRYMGLVPVGSDSDLDIILYNPKESALELCENLQKESPSATKPLDSKYQGEANNLRYIFEIDKIKVDIFIEPLKVQDLLSVENNSFEITTADWIVAKKRNSGRDKDWKQLYQMANRICKTSEFISKMGGQF